MSIELSLISGAVASIAGIVSLVTPLFRSYFSRLRGKDKESITISIKTSDGEVRIIELHGETGDYAIEKILMEVKNGNEATKPT